MGCGKNIFLSQEKIFPNYLEVSLFFEGSESEIVPPWFEIFNKELMQTPSFSDHEAFDHPVACKSLSIWKVSYIYKICGIPL